MIATGNFALRLRTPAAVLSDGGSWPSQIKRTMMRDTAARHDRCSPWNSTCDNEAHKVNCGV